MLSLLIVLLFLVLIAGVLMWCIDMLPFGTPQAKQIAKVIVALVALIYALQRFGGVV